MKNSGTREANPDNRKIRIIEVQMTEIRLYCYTPEAVKMSHSFTRLSFPPEASKKCGADPLVS